jgi:hypothetical protein
MCAVSPITVKPWSMKKLRPDLGARVDVDRREEAAEMVHQPRQEEQIPLEQPMRHPVEAERPHARIKQDFPAAPRRRVPRLTESR